MQLESCLAQIERKRTAARHLRWKFLGVRSKRFSWHERTGPAWSISTAWRPMSEAQPDSLVVLPTQYVPNKFFLISKLAPNEFLWSMMIYVSFNSWAAMVRFGLMFVWSTRSFVACPLGAQSTRADADAQCFSENHADHGVTFWWTWLLMALISGGLWGFSIFSPPVFFIGSLQYVSVYLVGVYCWRLHTGHALFDSIHFSPPARALSGRAPRDYGRVSGRLQCLAESETHCGCIWGLSHS